ncbi:Tad domain-containing protein [Halovulum sp. GXIMD14794]
MKSYCSAQIRAFRDDEEGSIIAFVVVLFLLMVVASGMAVDFMRHEAARADLQNALDRGVLAAAALSQEYVEEKIAADPNLTNDEDTIDEQYGLLVKSYMASRSFPIVPEIEVDVTQTFNGKEIEASAEYEMKTFFLRIMGLSRMKVPAVASATQVAHDIEISLVLDISGSMYDNTLPYVDDKNDDDPSNDEDVNWQRITILKREAKRFVNQMIDADPSPDKSKTSVSLVPYSHQVSLSPAMAAHYRTFNSELNPDAHDRSYCIDFEPEDFNDTLISPTTVYDQTRHFKVYTKLGKTIYGCSTSENAILPASNDKTAIGEAIDGLTNENWTAVYQGMKWGVSMLDPGTRPVFAAMASSNQVPAEFANLPRDWSSSGSSNLIKVVVLISDGANTLQYRVGDPWYDDKPPEGVNKLDWWATNQGSKNDAACDASGSSNTKPVWSAHNGQYSGGAPRCPNGIGDFTSYRNPLTKNNSGQQISLADARLYEICREAKEKNVRIYTIGFAAESRARRALTECASPGYDFTAGGTDLRSVFKLIEADIKNLKLIN